MAEKKKKAEETAYVFNDEFLVCKTASQMTTDQTMDQLQVKLCSSFLSILYPISYSICLSASSQTMKSRDYTISKMILL